MNKSITRGYFITVEGSDGVGKSTQIHNIENYFLKLGYEVQLTREPGGTRIGDKLRDILLDVSNDEMNEMTEMLIYAASRAQHIKELIEPSLKKGKIVISDRYIDSSIAYQGYGRRLGEDAVKIVNEYASYGLIPDLTFWLDLDPELGRKRILSRSIIQDKNVTFDRIELEKNDFHNRVREGYKEIARKNPERVHRIDASLKADEVWEEIELILRKII